MTRSMPPSSRPSSGGKIASSALLPVALTLAASATALGAFILALRTYRSKRRHAAAARAKEGDNIHTADATPVTAAAAAPVVDEYSIPLPSSYTASVDYSLYDLHVLFPSTIESEREKHYAVMASAGLVGASATLLSPQDAQKKACTIGLDDSQIELHNSLQLLNMRSVTYVHVSLDSYSSLFVDVSASDRARILVLNLCDGTEVDGIPGISVLRHLRSIGVAYTGADEAFFTISTYKQRMKKAFEARDVNTSTWIALERTILREWAHWRTQEGKPIQMQTEQTELTPDQTNQQQQQQQPSSTSSDADSPSPRSPTSLPCSLESSFSPSLSSLLVELRSLHSRGLFPLLVKPDDSYCSCGISTRSVGWFPEETLDYAASIENQFSAIFAEQFIRGREFTVLVTGQHHHQNSTSSSSSSFSPSSSSSAAASVSAISAVPSIAAVSSSPSSHDLLPQLLSCLSLSSLTTGVNGGSGSERSGGGGGGGLRSYAPVERIFDVRLPFYERFISYELFWEIARAATARGEDEFVFGPVSNEEHIWIKSAPTPAVAAAGTAGAGALDPVRVPLSEALQAEALRAYIAVGGCGYARVDIRVDEVSGRIQVLEVNANCGITQYRQTAMGEILRETNIGFYQLLDTLFADALQRQTKDKRQLQ